VASAPSSNAEHALDPVYARKLGVNIDELLISAARHRRAGAGNLRHAGALRRGRRAGESIRWAGPMVPRAELEGEMGDCLARAPSSFDESGIAQAHRLDQQIQHHGDLHQSNPDEDRR